MLHKTLDDAIETARQVVEEFGEDYVYTEHYVDCCYSIEGCPVCLVGHVLAKWGVLPEDVDSSMKDKSRRGSMYARELLKSMSSSGELETDDATRTFLTEVQVWQDSDTPWGMALQEGLRKVGRSEQ